MEGVDFRQYLIRIAIINWLLSLFRADPDLCTHESLMQELAEWLWSDVCALEGCDNPMLGYRSHAIYCSPACRKSSPEYKAHQSIYNKTPKRRARQRVNDRKYKDANKEMLRVKSRDRRTRDKAKYQAMEEELIELRAKLAALASQ
jgi:hypothetical protein